MEIPTVSPLRILTIDGGGLRGLAAIITLQQLKSKTGKEPHELFDFMCGTSTGGLIVLLVCLLKIPIEECKDLYMSFGKKVFDGSTGMLSMVSALCTGGSMHSHEVLEMLVKDATQKWSGSESRKLCELPPNANTPHIAVVAVRNETPSFFRNYSTDDGEASGLTDVFIWQAARATSAAPGYFDSIQIGMSNNETFF